MNLSVAQSVDYTIKLIRFLNSDIKNLDKLEIFIFPDFLSLYQVSRIIKGTRVKLGAQNCFWEDKGAFTGEVSPLFLKEIGCSYIIVGHPERVIQLKEDNRMINMKIKAVLKNKMKPLLLLFQKKNYTNTAKAFKIIRNELLLKIDGITNTELSRIIIVFEPLWAIGTGMAISVEHISETAY